MSRNRESKGPGDGGDKGGDNGAHKGRRRIVHEFWDFCDTVGPRLAEYGPMAMLSYYDGDGRPFGDPAGKILLEPLDTLDERLRAFVDGPCVVAIRTRDTLGQWSTVGKFRVKGSAPPPVAADSSMSAMLALLQKQNDELRADMKAIMDRQVAAPAKAAQEVDAFARFSETLKGLGLGPAAAVAAAPAALAKSLAEQMAEMRSFKALAGELFPASTTGDVTMALVLKEFSPGLNDMIRATGALVAEKVEANRLARSRGADEGDKK